MFEQLKCAQQLLKEIEKNQEQAYIVGGFVRDRLLLKSSEDIDICTSMKKEQLKKNFHVLEERLGSCIIEYRDYKFEVTTFRKEIGQKNHRYPEKIVFVETLEEDLMRRDFTINTLCYDSKLKLIDKLNGQADIKQKIIRTVGEADKRINEDALRILRAIRFATILHFQVDKELEQAIMDNKELLKEISYQRKKEELNKIFEIEHSTYGRTLLIKYGLLDVLEIPHLKHATMYPDALLVWMQLEVDKRYPFTKEEQKQMNYLRICQKEPWNIDRIYESSLETAIKIGILKGKSEIEMNLIRNSLPIQNRKELQITAKELQELCGKNQISSVYQKIEHEILIGKLKNQREDIYTFVKLLEKGK